MAPARLVGWAFFPLDEQLGLLAGGMTPRAEELLARLASWMPFEPACELLEELLGVRVSKATARRATLATGEAALAVSAEEEERLKQETPQAPTGAEKQAISGDGAYVLWVGGEWVEVKTLTIGEVTRTKRGDVCIQQISSFARLANAERFAEAALVETHRRGVEQATAVCAVQDGAEWLQGLVDYHRTDAVRILDFAHAAEYVNAIGEAVRAAHMQYPIYQQAGWPIGSGSVESANKVVVEARLKGAGMRWERQNVNPMLVLRNAVCNRHWHQTWTTAGAHRRALRTSRRQAQSQQRLAGAFWFLVIWGTRVYRLSHPPGAAATAPTESLQKPPTRRLGSGYSWRKPFLRRPPSTPVATEEVCAKK